MWTASLSLSLSLLLLKMVCLIFCSCVGVVAQTHREMLAGWLVCRIQRMTSALCSCAATDFFSIIAYILVQQHIRSMTDSHTGCFTYEAQWRWGEANACLWMCELLFRAFNLDVNILVWHHSRDKRCLSYQTASQQRVSQRPESHTRLGITVHFSKRQQLCERFCSLLTLRCLLLDGLRT